MAGLRDTAFKVKFDLSDLSRMSEVNCCAFTCTHHAANTGMRGGLCNLKRVHINGSGQCSSFFKQQQERATNAEA